VVVVSCCRGSAGSSAFLPPIPTFLSLLWGGGEESLWKRFVGVVGNEK